ncbi:hypothetical protein EJ06DRAFT_264282 [Trichodelitschia bisporula]|uniref:Uncharacterized protein n=1 Tax=Trichodelitschia bisporula TaxID=703511 RepID=A0A6G1HIY6_9PEZI|nr:hypothetical protein EJ06DRAFT_264282 [Trichodelitschia bisporula]
MSRQLVSDADTLINNKQAPPSSQSTYPTPVLSINSPLAPPCPPPISASRYPPFHTPPQRHHIISPSLPPKTRRHKKRRTINLSSPAPKRKPIIRKALWGIGRTRTACLRYTAPHLISPAPPTTRTNTAPTHAQPAHPARSGGPTLCPLDNGKSREAPQRPSISHPMMKASSSLATTTTSLHASGRARGRTIP